MSELEPDRNCFLSHVEEIEFLSWSDYEMCLWEVFMQESIYAG